MVPRPIPPNKSIMPKFKTSLAMQKGIIAPRRRVTLPFFEATIGTPPVLVDSVTTVQSYRLNSCFDPRYAIGGAQPMGFDQWAAMYKRYTVVSCSITVKCNPLTASYYGGNFGVNVVPEDSGSIPVVTSEADAITSPWSKWNTYTQSAAAGKIVFKWDAAKYFGVDDIMDGDDFGSVVTNNPLRQAVAVVWISADVNTQPTSMMNVYMEYDVIFHEPKEIGGS